MFLKLEKRMHTKEPPVPANMRSVRYGHIWHHELARHGLPTGGGYPNERILELAEIPEDLTGKTVLDIGTLDGFYAIECANRGASKVMALDHPNWGMAGHPTESLRGSFEYARAELDTRRVIEPREAILPYADSVFGEEETFDIVLFMGVLYHLRPEHLVPTMRFLSRRMHKDSLLIIETSIADVNGKWPSITTYPEGFFNDKTNHVAPNYDGLAHLLTTAGFSTERMRHVNSWAQGYVGPGTERAIVHVIK